MADTRHYPATAYQTLFDSAALTGGKELRRKALDTLLENGVPSRRVEGWKWTDLRALAEAPLPLAAPVADPTAQEDTIFAGTDMCRLVIVNGAYRPDLSDAVPAGLQILSSATVLADALNGRSNFWAAAAKMPMPR